MIIVSVKINHTIQKFGLACIFIFFSHMVVAQDKVDESTEFWQSLYLKYDVSKKWSSEFRVDARYSFENEEISKYLAEIETGYELINGLSGQVIYRYIVLSDDDNRHRYAIQLTPEIDLEKFEIVGRTRLEVNSNNSKSKTRYRVRIRPGYDFGKADLQISPEWFISSKGKLDKIRYSISIGYKLNKKNKVKVKFMIDEGENERVSIFRLLYSYRIS